MKIRSVLQHPKSKLWAFVEWNDHSSFVLGGKEFNTQDEAYEYSKGFDTFSYEWVEPSLLAKNILEADIDRLSKELEEKKKELENL